MCSPKHFGMRTVLYSAQCSTLYVQYLAMCTLAMCSLGYSGFR